MVKRAHNIAVLMGGPSSEREISLISGRACSDALRQRGYEITEIDFDLNTYNTLNELRPDAVFIALHGRPGEDGTVQGMLEVLGLPYTGSGVLASALAIDKARTREFLQGNGIVLPRGISLRSTDELPEAIENLKEQGVDVPLIVKPTQAGSSVGLTRVENADILKKAVELALEYSPEALIEECLPGPEVTVSIIGNGHPIILPTIEIISEKGIYDYEAKYTPGMSHHIIPPDIDPEKVRQAEEMAFRAYRLMGLNGCGRGELIFDKEMVPHFLEFNTIPGMTEISLLPDAARAAGIEFGELCERLISYALDKYEKTSLKSRV
ncbi:MAG TPA: D-alanine--D-alanine ligase [Firmicutes bacterium]|nr:D-alanine--D-alanine ligase [Bacillota bacterium]